MQPVLAIGAAEQGRGHRGCGRARARRKRRHGRRALLVTMLGDHTTLVRRVVAGVIASAAIAMLRSARTFRPCAPVPTVAKQHFAHCRARVPAVAHSRHRQVIRCWTGWQPYQGC